MLKFTMWNPFKKKNTNQFLLHKVQNAFGTIEVKESQTIRSLHFGSDSQQSSMYLHDSKELVLKYTRSLALGLLLKDNLNSLLLLGLGGGSMVKFIHHHYPSCHVDVVEYNKEVKNIAYKYFELPKNKNIQIHLDDAGNFIRSAKAKEYDLIMVDAYSGDGMSKSVQGIDFFNTCFTHLRPGGFFCINLWVKHNKILQNVRQALNSCFSNQVLSLPVEDKANLIIFAIKGPLSSMQKKGLINRAKKLSKQTDINFLHLIRNLRQYNPTLFKYFY